MTGPLFTPWIGASHVDDVDSKNLLHLYKSPPHKHQMLVSAWPACIEEMTRMGRFGFGRFIAERLAMADFPSIFQRCSLCRAIGVQVLQLLISFNLPNRLSTKFWIKISLKRWEDL